MPRKGVPQTFSLKAVDNLTVLSSGQQASGGTGNFWMSFIRGFRYQKLGIVSTLRNDTFTLNGTINENGIEYLVKKPALFGISVVNREPGQIDQLQGNDEPAQAGRPVREIATRRRKEDDTMRKRYALGTAAAAGLVFVLACITVNIYFPEATVKQAAAEIVEEIRKDDVAKKAPQAALEMPALRESPSFSFVPAAYAQEATSVSTPAIRALKDSMKSRFPSLKPYFDAGNIGESNKGLLDVRDEAGLNLQAKAALRNLVKDENGDRTKLYAEVAQALKIEASQIEKIQKIFADEWAKSAMAGWWVQQEDGAWVKKS